jgi:hypothetical protein
MSTTHMSSGARVGSILPCMRTQTLWKEGENGHHMHEQRCQGRLHSAMYVGSQEAEAEQWQQQACSAMDRLSFWLVISYVGL